MDMSEEIATLAGGCFWCLEAVFKDLRGVNWVMSGYSGGQNANPSYKEVCSGTTGHAEVVQVRFDPDLLTYADLLRVFFAIHDPTTLNRQGNDIGTQYRSAIFTHDGEQHAEALASKAAQDASGRFRRPIVTEVTSAKPFYRAEEYHQRYLEKHGRAGCSIH
jgi:peptide-methionine (S)-S-oxide reductase